VEDDSGVRDYAQEVLQHMGYSVVAAANGPEAIECLRQRNDIDLLFTDVMMPGGMSGAQLAEQARLLYPNLPVLFTWGTTRVPWCTTGGWTRACCCCPNRTGARN